MHSPLYVPVEALQSPMPALAAGCSGVPEVLTVGGVISTAASILFSTNFAAGDTITFGGITLTAVVATPTNMQFVPGASLAISLTALTTQFQNLSMPVAGAFSNTAGTTLTFTPTGYGYTSANLWSYAVPVPASNVKATGTNTVATNGAGVTQTFSTNFVTGDSISFAGVTLTAIASNLANGNASAPNAGQFVPSATLSQTLALVTLLFDALVPFTTATFATDSATYISAVSPVVKSAVAYAVGAVKASGGTNTPTQSTNLGSPAPTASIDTEHTQLNSVAGGIFVIPVGIESQRKTFVNMGTGAWSGRGSLPNAFVNLALAAGQAAHFVFLGGKWRTAFVDGAVLS